MTVTKVGMVFANYLVLAIKQTSDAIMRCQPWVNYPGPGLVNNSSNSEEIKMKTLINYRPSSLENVLNGFDRYMDSFFGDSFRNHSDRFAMRLPAVDVRETEKNYVLEMDLPGFDEKDIEIRLDGNNLTISSKKEQGEDAGEIEDGNFLMRERRSTTFSRSFKLPENIDPEQVSAGFKNGVLVLSIGKRAETQTRVIQISKN